MLRTTAPRFTCSMALMGVLAGPAQSAWAADPTIVAPPAAPVAPAVVADRPWQRVAIPLALLAAGAGLVTGVGFDVAYHRRTSTFNDHMNPKCNSGVSGNGGPICDDLYANVTSASRWSNVGFGAAAAFALTALVIKLTEPAPGHAMAGEHAAAPSPRLACAPGLGLNASCIVTF
jgi:hypothetical protein